MKRGILEGVLIGALVAIGVAFAGSNGLEGGGSANPVTIYKKGATGASGTVATAISDSDPLPAYIGEPRGAFTAYHANQITNQTLNYTNTTTSPSINASAYSWIDIAFFPNATTDAFSVTPYYGVTGINQYAAGAATSVTGYNATNGVIVTFPTKRNPKFFAPVTGLSSGANITSYYQLYN